MRKYAIITVIVLCFLGLRYSSFAIGRSAATSLKTNPQQNQLRHDEKSNQLISQDRMEDRGCCVLKKSQYKPEWEFVDDQSRRICIQTAHDVGVDYDFHKSRKCVEVKKDK